MRGRGGGAAGAGGEAALAAVALAALAAAGTSGGGRGTAAAGERRRGAGAAGRWVAGAAGAAAVEAEAEKLEKDLLSPLLPPLPQPRERACCFLRFRRLQSFPIRGGKLAGRPRPLRKKKGFVFEFFVVRFFFTSQNFFFLSPLSLPLALSSLSLSLSTKLLTLSAASFCSTRCSAVSTHSIEPAISSILSCVPGKYSRARDSCILAPLAACSASIAPPPRLMTAPAAELETSSLARIRADAR